MGGNQSTSCFCFKCIEDEEEREPRYSSSNKVRPSDEDRGCYWVGEPDVDKKATAFIAKFHEARFMDLETQTAGV